MQHQVGGEKKIEEGDGISASAALAMAPIFNLQVTRNNSRHDARAAPHLTTTRTRLVRVRVVEMTENIIVVEYM